MPEAVAACWASYVAATGVRGEPLEAFGFGDSTELTDDLADLVLAGTKRATAGAVAGHGALLVAFGRCAREPMSGGRMSIARRSGSS